MPIINSAIKRVRQAAKRRSRNLQIKRAIHEDVRAFHDAVSSGDANLTHERLRAAISELDRAVKTGTIHRNTAARRKSKLTKAANPLILTGGKPKPVAKKSAPAKKAATPKKAVTKKPAAKPSK